MRPRVSACPVRFLIHVHSKDSSIHTGPDAARGHERADANETAHRTRHTSRTHGTRADAATRGRPARRTASESREAAPTAPPPPRAYAQLARPPIAASALSALSSIRISSRHPGSARACARSRILLRPVSRPRDLKQIWPYKVARALAKKNMCNQEGATLPHTQPPHARSIERRAPGRAQELMSHMSDRPRDATGKALPRLYHSACAVQHRCDGRSPCPTEASIVHAGVPTQAAAESCERGVHEHDSLARTSSVRVPIPSH